WVNRPGRVAALTLVSLLSRETESKEGHFRVHGRPGRFFRSGSHSRRPGQQRQSLRKPLLFYRWTPDGGCKNRYSANGYSSDRPARWRTLDAHYNEWHLLTVARSLLFLSDAPRPGRVAALTPVLPLSLETDSGE